MQEPKDTVLAHEMAAFCRQQAEKRSSRHKNPRIVKAVLGVVVAALMPSSSIFNSRKWDR